MTLQLTKQDLRSGKESKKDFNGKKRVPISILLDDLMIGQNIGSIFRTADALLLEKIYLYGNSIVPPNKKISKAAHGNERWVPFAIVDDPLKLIHMLKGNSITIISAELARNSIPYSRFEYKNPVCVIFGNERRGVREDLLKISDIIVHVPMFGMGNSLNVAVTAGIICSHIANQIIRMSSNDCR